MKQVEEDAIVGHVSPIIRISYTLVQIAIKDNVTEMHIEPEMGKTAVYHRIGGVLQRVMNLPAHIYPRLVTRYKVLAEVSWASNQQPAKGHFTLRHKGRYYDVEVTFPVQLFDPRITMVITAGGEAEADDEDSLL